MRWNLQSKTKDQSQIRKVLLENRGLKDKKDISEFLDPTHPSEFTAKLLGLNDLILKRTVARIKQAIKNSESIVVYGDYDADGICATAIVWETLRDLGAKVMPFIPQREKEGYGISIDGIDAILADEKYSPGKSKKGSLIITVDSGIVAASSVDYARRNSFDVIIIDHHEKPKKLPEAQVILHTTKLCAAGICYFLSLKLNPDNKSRNDASLELAAIATVTDLVPLLGPNRAIVKFGLELLNKTPRPGLRALFNIAGIEKVGTYEIGFMIGPRINASGRIENALTALRMLCTNDFKKALEYAQMLDATNRQRQKMTEEMTMHAVQTQDTKHKSQDAKEKIIVLEHESYHQGVIGLIAGKLVETYYLPAIVIAKGENLSKASARSISGFNIIEAIRTTSDLLVDAGGHPMAAGFTIETAKIEEFKKRITHLASRDITDNMLERQLRVDCYLELPRIDWNFYQEISKFAPYGLGNPEPTFVSSVEIIDLRTVGSGKHLKLTVKDGNQTFDAIAFNRGNLFGKVKSGEKVQIAYTISPDSYNGDQKLQLKIKDMIY